MARRQGSLYRRSGSGYTPPADVPRGHPQRTNPCVLPVSQIISVVMGIGPSITSSITSSVAGSFGGALVPVDFATRFNDRSIVGSPLVTAWNNVGPLGSPHDAAVILGTAANLRRHENACGLFYGASGDYCSTPDSALNSLTGNFAAFAYIAPDSWASGWQTVKAKWANTGNQRAYSFGLRPSGSLGLTLSSDGANSTFAESTVATGFTAGSGHWVASTWDVITQTANYFTSNQGKDTLLGDINWVQLGDASIPLAQTAIFDSNAAVEVGSYNVGTLDIFKGSIYRAYVCISIGTYVSLDGTGGTYVSQPDSVANSITGDIDIRTRLVMTDWTPAGISAVVAKLFSGATGNASYALQVNTLGNLTFLGYSDAITGADINVTSTLTNGFTNGDVAWVRATVDVDDGFGNHVVKFYTGTTTVLDSTQVTWVQLGDTVTTAGTHVLNDSATVLEIGSIVNGTVQNLDGHVYKVEIFDGYDGAGTLRVEMDPADADFLTDWTLNGNAAITTPALKTAFNAKDGGNKSGVANDTFVSSEVAETWTMHGNTFIQNTGYPVTNPNGSVGLETAVGQDVVPPMTLFFVVKFHDPTPSADQFIFDARANAAKSVRVFTDFSNSNRLTLDCGGTPIVLTAAYSTDIQIITVQHNADATTAITSSVLGSISGDAGTETLDFGTFFADLAGANTSQLLAAEAIGYHRELAAWEVGEVQSFLVNKWST